MYIKDVSSYDKNTLTSLELVEDIFSIESELERQTIINACRDRAKECGCLKAFDQLIISAKKDLKKMKSEVVAVDQSNTIEYDNVTFNSGSWNYDEYGIYILDKYGKSYACPHAIFPRRILVNAEDSLCKIEIVFQVRSNAWRTISVQKSIIANVSKIISLADYGVQVTSENAKLLVKYLADIEALNPDLIYEQTSTSRLGWVNNVFVPYCNDSIVFDNEQSMKSLFSSVKESGSYDIWHKCVCDIRRQKKFPVLIYLAASLASVLVEPCGTLPFIVSIWGATGLGKTVALSLAASIWADPSEGKYMADAKATTTAMEIRLDCLNSLPMCLDDMAQVQSKFDGDFSQLIYYWCQGKGRERSNQALGLNKPTRWSNCTLTNGERSMITESTQGGAINRVIDVEIGDKPMFTDGNKIVKTLKSNHGFCGKMFVQVIQSMGFEAVYQLFDKYMKLLRSESEKSGCLKEDKQLTPMALILTADELSEEFIYKDGVRLDIRDCLAVLKDRESTSEYKRAYEYLEGVVAMNSAHFWDDSIDGSYEIWGHKFDTDNDTYAIIKNRFDEILAAGGFQAKSFVIWAVRNGIIQQGNEKDARGKNRTASRFTLGNKTRPRCYIIKFGVDLDAKDEEIDIDLDEEPFEAVPFVPFVPQENRDV